jgi:mannose-1-phosphate guanylyltransferase
MAGGIGTRLWPISRQAMPKQFQKLIGDETLLQQTFRRINKVIPAKNIWVQTAAKYVPIVTEQLTAINPKHIISEPAVRGTAPAAGLATLTILKEDPEALIFGIVPSDHYIGKEKVFTQTTKEIFEFLEKNPKYIAAIGIQPTEPNTGLGYIKKGAPIDWPGRSEIFQVDSFVEKPDQLTAEKFVATGDYLWNGGYYLYKGAVIVKYFQDLLPETYALLEKFISSPTDSSIYEAIETASFDNAISEKIKHLAVIPASMEWSDVGNWAAIHDILSAKGHNNQVVTGNHIGNGSENTLVVGGSKLIATVGLKDIVVIDTEDVLLICHKDNVQNVKNIVEELKSSGQEKYL